MHSSRCEKRHFPEPALPGKIIKISMEDPVKKVVNVQSDGALRPIITVPASDGQLSRRCSNIRRSLYFGKSSSYWALMIVNSFILVVGASSATLLGRLYFVHGGSHRWLYTWIQTVGWPINLVPLFFCYFRSSTDRPTPLTLKLCIIYVAMGCITAFDNLLYSWGISYLPVSTNSLLCASQLAFNALFSFALVGKKITPCVINSVFAITIGAILLGLYAGSDRPQGTTEKQYILGFGVTIAGSAINALMLPLLELIYRKVLEKDSFSVVLEAQTAISMIATVFCMVGMWINGDFAAIHEEAAHFNLGSTLYSTTLLGSAIGWQLFFLGSAGIVFLASSLMSCVFMTAMLPVLSVLAVIFFQDKFSALKGIAMLLSMWGFISYIYGGYVECESKKAVGMPNSDDLQILSM